MSTIAYKDVMARQFNGPVIQSLLRAAHEGFDESGAELILHRNDFSVDTATTEELDWLGLLCNVPRPYAVVDDKIVLADDDVYKLFFKNVMALRQSQSLVSLANVFYQFIPNGEFDLTINPTTGDIRVVIDVTFEQYWPFLEQATKSVYTASPQLTPFEIRDYFYFIWDNMLYLRYMQLAQPNVWTFSYDSDLHKLSVVSTDPSYLTVGFDEGQLIDNGDGTYTPRESCYDKDTISEGVISEYGALVLQPMYKTYNDENNVQHTDGPAVFAKKPGVPDASVGTEYSVLYKPKEQDKPLAVEQPNMALLVGYDSENQALKISNDANTPNSYFDNTPAPYGKGSEDGVQRSDVSYDAETHAIKLSVFNVRRVPTWSVTHE